MSRISSFVATQIILINMFFRRGHAGFENTLDEYFWENSRTYWIKLLAVQGSAV